MGRTSFRPEHLDTEFRGWKSGEFVLGARRCATALRGAVSSPKVRQATTRFAALQLLAVLVSFLLSSIVWFLLFSLIWLLSCVPWPRGVNEIVQATYEKSSYSVVLWIVLCVPDGTLLLLRCFAEASNAEVFFRAVDVRSPLLAQRLEALQPETWWAWCVRYVRQTGRNFTLLFITYVLSFLPLFGPFVYPVCLITMTAWKCGYVMACVSLCGFLVPRGACAWAVQAVFQSRSVGKELLHPALTRMPQRARRWFLLRHNARVTGFALVASCLLTVPLFGGFLWFPLVSSAGEILSDCCAEDTHEEDAHHQM